MLERLRDNVKKADHWTEIFDISVETNKFMKACAGILNDIFVDFAHSAAKGLDVKFDPMTTGTANWVRSHSFDLAKGINQTTTGQLRDTLLEGHKEGESAEKLVSRIKNVYSEATGYRAMMIARTETTFASNAGTLAAYKWAGIQNKEWLASGDERQCPICMELDRKVVHISQEFAPGIFSPPGHPSCRCSIIANESKEDFQFRKEYDQAIDQVINYPYDPVSINSVEELLLKRYNLPVQIEPGIPKDRIKESLLDFREALESLPKEALNHQFLTRVKIGEVRPGCYGYYNHISGDVVICNDAFIYPALSSMRSNLVYETTLHELGHAYQRSIPGYENYANELWDLPIYRRTRIGHWEGYRVNTGKLKDSKGITDYGETDPLEDWAETWKLLYGEPSKFRIYHIYETKRDELGRLVKRKDDKGKDILYYRYRLMRQMLTSHGLGVPEI